MDQYQVTAGQDYWQVKVTESKNIQNPGSLYDCFNECLIVRKDTCQFLVYDSASQICHTGALDSASEGTPVTEPIVDDVKDLQNPGEDCWSHCNGEQGPCHWCGADGWCCKQGWTVGNGCDGSFGGENMHECVLKPGKI